MLILFLEYGLRYIRSPTISLPAPPTLNLLDLSIHLYEYTTREREAELGWQARKMRVRTGVNRHPPLNPQGKDPRDGPLVPPAPHPQMSIPAQRWKALGYAICRSAGATFLLQGSWLRPPCNSESPVQMMPMMLQLTA